MKPLSTFLTIVIFFVFSHSGRAEMMAKEALFTASSQDQIAQDTLDMLREMNGVPGMAVAVFQNGKIRWHGESGYADVASMTPVNRDTRFRLASVSKLITITQLARLVEQGKISLDDPLTNYLPAYPGTPDTITIEQLAAHTSGTGHYQAGEDTRHRRHYASSNDALEIFQDRPLRFTPGTDYHYSSYGYTLLAAAMEAAAGQTFDKQWQSVLNQQKRSTPYLEDIRNPHPLESSIYTQAQKTTSRKLRKQDFSYSWAGAGFVGTATDLVTLAGDYFNASLVSKATFERFLTPHQLVNGDIVTDGRFSVAVGWRISVDSQGRRMVHHAGVTDGARSVLVVYPEQEMAIAVLSNASWISSIDLTASGFAQIFLSDKKTTASCPQGKWNYTGSFGDEPVAGFVTFNQTDGLCKGIMNTRNNALGTWLKGHRGLDAGPLHLLSRPVAHASHNTLPMAIVSSLGIFSGQVDVAPDLAFEGSFGSRNLSLKLEKYIQ